MLAGHRQRRTWKLEKEGMPGPHRPRRSMYPRLRGSEAPVALQYTTLALGRARCSPTTACPTYTNITFYFPFYNLQSGVQHIQTQLGLLF